MATFISENQVLKGRNYKVPDELVTYLKKIRAKYQGINPQNKGAKRIEKLTDTTNQYNKKTKGGKQQKNGVYVTYGDLKRIKHDFDHMAKDPNNLQRILNGGVDDEHGNNMERWVNNTLNTERTAVAPIVQQNKEKNQELSQTKPVKNPTKPIEINGQDVHVQTESTRKIIITNEQKERLGKKLNFL